MSSRQTTVRLAAVVLLIATLGTVALPAAAGTPEELSAVADWLAEELEGSGEVVDADSLQQELTRRLEDAGVDEPVAASLTDRRTDETPDAALRRAQRRIERYAQAGRGAGRELPEGSTGRLARILDDPQFVDEPEGVGTMERLSRRLMEWIGGLIGRVFSLFGGGTVTVLLLLALSIFVVVAAFVLLRWLMRLDPAPIQQLPYREGHHQTLALDATPQAMLEAARGELTAGRLIEALRLVERAAIGALKSRGLLPREPGLTDRESLRELRDGAAPDLRAALTELVSIHERFVYSGEGATRELTGRALDLGTSIVLPEEESR
ncbi:hypothetical protein ABI59_20715 [Acidobacteria bacterium Mor1]|nr:hypothetical protein ABI59_20715 [Acidobacteria bacterium Mor1]